MRDKVLEELRRENLDDWRNEPASKAEEWMWHRKVKGREQQAKWEKAKVKVGA